MKKSELNFLIEEIIYNILTEYSSLSSSDKPGIDSKDSVVDPLADKDAKSTDPAQAAIEKSRKRKELDQKKKDIELKRKGSDAEYKRNVAMSQQYKNSEKPRIKAERDAINKELRQL